MAAGDKAFWADVANAINRPMVKMTQAVAQSLPNATDTALSFTTEDLDTNGFHDTTTNNSRVTPTIAGWYECRGTVFFSASASITVVAATIAQNGSVVAPRGRPKPGTANVSTTAEVAVSLSFNGSSDYVELFGNQTSGGALNTNVGGSFASVFEVIYLRPL